MDLNFSELIQLNIFSLKIELKVLNILNLINLILFANDVQKKNKIKLISLNQH